MWAAVAHVNDYENFIPTKFHQNTLSGYGEELDNVFNLTDNPRATENAFAPMTY